MLEIIGVTTAIISTTVAIYLALKLRNFNQKAADIIDFLVADTETQKKLYFLGVILGNGIKQGIGISAKGGKFKMEDLIGQGLGMFMQKFLGQSQQPQQEGTFIG